MNTSFLSALSAAPPPGPTSQPRPAKGGKVAPEAINELETDKPEASGDSDKADAFAEMLAAMLSVTTPVAETRVETTESTAVDSVTATATDVPRDGAGSPLFASSFITTTASDTKATGASLTTVDLTAATGASAASTADAASDLGPAMDASAITDVADPGVETADAVPVAEVATEANVTTTDANPVTLEQPQAVVEEPPHAELPIVEVRETSSAATESNTRPSSTDNVVETEHPAEPVSTEAPALESPVGNDSHPILKEAAPASDVADTVGKAAEPVVQEAPAPKIDVQPEAGEQATFDETGVDPANQLEDAPQAATASGSDRATAAPRSPRTAASTTNQSVTASADTGAVSEPVLAEALTAVDQTSEVALQNDPARDQKVQPDSRDDKSAIAAMDGEAISGVSAMMTEGVASPSPSIATISSADAAVASAPVNVTQQVMQALAAYEADLPQNGARSFEMLLDPPELGRLLVQMSRTSKGVDVRISAENESVRSMLETTGAELQQSLQLSGFDLGQFSGSGSGGTFAGAEEWVSAPTLQSFATSPAVAHTRTATATTNSAVNVVV